MDVIRKVIDISQFNTVVDWGKVKKTGYHVIIRIGYRGSKTGVITYDPRYKEYKNACEKYGIPYSLYFFPCSINDTEAHEEALFIKGEVLASKIKMPIWLDSEVVQTDRTGRSDKLSKDARTRYLKIILDDLLDWGIPCGIYASRSWFYNNIDMDKIPADAVANTWVAEYGVSMTKYTKYFVMWQYSSKESVSGINGNVDMSNQYYNFNMKIAGKEAEPVKEAPVKEKSELEKIIEIAKGELGYLEKKSNSQLDDKTANAGSNNYTKYWRDIKKWCGANYQAQPWCAGWVTWVFTTALGQDRAKELLKHYPYVYCPTMAGKFTLYTNPQVGDIPIFWKNGAYAHTGFVIGVSGDNFTTIEGNTSGASKIIDNGGGVCQKTYKLSDVKGTRFCRPAYSSTTISSDSNKVTVADDMHTVKYKAYVNVDSLAVRLQPTTSASTCSFSPLKRGAEVGVSYESSEWVLIKYDGKYGYVLRKYIDGKLVEIIEPVDEPQSTSNESKQDGVKEDTTAKADTEKKEQVAEIDELHRIKWKGIITTDGASVHVRMLPSFTGKLCSISPLKNGTEVGVCNRQGDWYLIKYKGVWGYVNAPYLKKKQ